MWRERERETERDTGRMRKLGREKNQLKKKEIASKGIEKESAQYRHRERHKQNNNFKIHRSDGVRERERETDKQRVRKTERERLTVRQIEEVRTKE